MNKAVTTCPSAYCISLAVSMAVIGRPKKSTREFRKKAGWSLLSGAPQQTPLCPATRRLGPHRSRLPAMPVFLQACLTMVSSLCSGLRAEKAGGTCQAFPGRLHSRAAGWKGSSIHLAGTAEKYEEGCSDLGERAGQKGTTKGPQSSNR